MKLHPKFAVRDKIDDEEVDFQGELGWAKVRMTLLKEEEEKLDSEEDEDDLGLNEEDDMEDDQLQEIAEAKSRQYYDPEAKIFNYGRKRATDLKENSRVTLPKPVSAANEAGIEVRRKPYKNVVTRYGEEECNNKIEQKPNLSREETNGLKSLQRRIKNEEIVIIRTDKSSKLAAVNLETYVETGKKHTSKDKVITMAEVHEREKVVNGHTAMFIKMTGMGDDWGHGPRMRSSKMTKSKNTASLFLQLKDHKAELDSRGVVSACNSNTVGHSNILSEILESVANGVTNPTEVISSEDMLSRIHQCNMDLEALRKRREGAGEKLSNEEERLYLLGADVIALFPSMTSQRTGRIAREEVISSPVEFENLNCKEMARYVAVCEKLTSGVEEVRRLLPRRSKEGAKPEAITMKNKEIQGTETDTEIEWTFPSYTPTREERRILFGICCEIGVRILWENFCYSWNKKIYLQKSGGPIGARITMAASRLVMYQWGTEYTQILIRSNLDLRLFGIYVDDVRQGTGLLARGYRFVLEEKRFTHKIEWEREDEEENLSDFKRVGRECQKAMNSVNPDLQFTVESEEDFENGRIQTLDFEIKVGDDGLVEHNFFEKSMQTKLVTMERSAMGAH